MATNCIISCSGRWSNSFELKYTVFTLTVYKFEPVCFTKNDLMLNAFEYNRSTYNNT